MKAKEYLETQGIFALDTKKRYNETIKWLNAFAAYKLEEIREEAKKWMFKADSEQVKVVSEDDLNNIFDEKLKELK